MIKQLEFYNGNVKFYTVKRETEKAFLLEPDKIFNYNDKTIWVPKSALVLKNSRHNEQAVKEIKAVKAWFRAKLSKMFMSDWI